MSLYVYSMTPAALDPQTILEMNIFHGLYVYLILFPLISNRWQYIFFIKD